jgi:3-dehydroquinate synthase
MDTQQLTISVSHDATETSYPIWIGEGLLARLDECVDLSGVSSVFVVTDSNVGPHWLSQVTSGSLPVCGSIEVPAGEEHKNQDTLSSIWAAMREAGCDRRSLVLNLGGGVVGDMGGFAACTFMRGVPFVQIPTSLLAMVDASVGGKLGINAHGIKNLVGVFAQPRAVIMDLATLSTLPERERNAGMAEVIKHGLIADRGYLDDMADGTPDGLSSDVLLSLIRRSCQIKADVVEADEREGGIRKILNFGHTAGHAIESLLLGTDAPLLHGEAVALGMIVEAGISAQLGWLTPDDVSMLRQLLAQYKLPVHLPLSLPKEALFSRMLGDKKNVAGSICWTLLQAVGQATFDVTVPQKHVEQAFSLIEPAGEHH